jgi:8-oxo-dGTP pyrophosphatase MutT (NUDIX family)
VHVPEKVQNPEPRSNAVALLVTDAEGRMLVLWHVKYRFWTVPLGKIEPGEAGISAAEREAFEELGIVSKRVELLDTVYKPVATDDYSDITIALCHVTSYSGAIANREPDKHDQFRFMHPRDFGSLNPLSFPTQVIADRFSDQICASLPDV